MTSSLDSSIVQLGICSVESSRASTFLFSSVSTLFIYLFIFTTCPVSRVGKDHVDAPSLSRLVPVLALFSPRALCRIALATPSKCLIQPLAQTWQQSVTSAAAEQLPRWAPSALTNRLVKPRRDISPMESGDVSGPSGRWNFFIFLFPFLSLQHCLLC